MTPRGFTLIELVLVLAIVGVLMVALVNTSLKARVNARDTKRVAIMNDLRAALGRYNLANFSYPAGGFCDVLVTLIDGNYITYTPVDPKTNLGLCAADSGAVYTYDASPEASAVKNSYLLKLGLEGGGTRDFYSPQ